MTSRISTYGGKGNPDFDEFVALIRKSPETRNITLTIPNQSTVIEGPLQSLTATQISGFPMYHFGIGGEDFYNTFTVDFVYDPNATVSVEVPVKPLPEAQGSLIYITEVNDPMSSPILPNTPFIRQLDSNRKSCWRDIFGWGHLFYPHAILDFEVIELPPQKG